MASYRDARALFDEIVRSLRAAGTLKDDEPFSDAVYVQVTPYRVGQLAIDDVGPPGEPSYRVMFMISVDAYSGMPRPHPAPVDLTESTAEAAFERIQAFAQ